MFENRIRRFSISEDSIGENGPAPLPATAGFVLCPVILIAMPWQFQLYQAAFEKAKADAAPPPSALTGWHCWN
jgi:hypothetical protein